MRESINQTTIGEFYLDGSIEENHIQSLKSLCHLLLREVCVLSNLQQKTQKAPDFDRGISLAEEVERFEKNLIDGALLRCGGSQKKAAVLLGVKLTTLNAKIKRYKISETDSDKIIG
jgi:DNA-binding NtrC family response regulator